MPDAGDTALGALIVFAAASLGGVTGFGYALAAGFVGGFLGGSTSLTGAVTAASGWES